MSGGRQPRGAVSSWASAELSTRLRDWYRTARRDLPWRREPSAYRVWVSEVMLQQTQVATVVPYFERWMARFPTVNDLAVATEDDVLQLWQGLGYYSRARALLNGARAVVEHWGGEVPATVNELLALPGVGRYTAGAIASIAFGRADPVVDGNVIRVLCRVFGLRGDPARAPLKSRLWELAEELVPPTAASEHNQALMELGATVCTPRSPVCLACPLATRCVAHRDGLKDLLPELAKRPPPTPITMVAAMVRRGQKLLVVKPDTARWWSGLWQLPSGEVKRGETPVRAAQRIVHELSALDVTSADSVHTHHHSVTRFRVTLHAVRCAQVAGRVSAPRALTLAWKTRAELEELGMPAPHRRLLEGVGTA